MRRNPKYSRIDKLYCRPDQPDESSQYKLIALASGTAFNIQ